MKSIKIIKITSGLLALPYLAIAAPGDDTLALLGSEDLYIDDLPVVISATRLKQPLRESPVATTIIDRQMIDASGAQTIADVLRLVPGFTVGYISGNYPVATYHGQSERYSKRIQLVIDGRSVYLPTLSGVSWSDLVVTLDDIERIEVTRGPNASTHGNNAFLAVISITTKHASEDKGQYVKVTTGSHKTEDAVYRFGGQNGNLDYRVNLGTKNNDGTELLDDTTETDYLSYRLDYQLNNSTSMFYQGGFQDSVYGDLLENADDTPNDVDVKTAFQHFKLQHDIDASTSYSVQYYYNYTDSYDSNYATTVSLASFAPLFPGVGLEVIDDFDVYDTIDLESERHDLEFNYYYSPLDSLRLVSGASVRADKVIADNVFHQGAEDTLWLYRVFTHGEYLFTDDWILNAGFMLEDNEISGTDVSPRVSVIHHLTENHSLRLNVSKATRTPTLFDENGYYAIEQTLTQNNGQPLDNPVLETILDGDTIVDPFFFSSGGVESEEIVSYEFGWMAQLADNSLTLDTKIYYDETEKLIAEVPYNGDVPGENVDELFGSDYDGVGAKDAANASSTTVKGIEISADYKASIDWRIYSFIAYTRIDAKIDNPVARASVAGRLEESIPRRSFGTMLMKTWPKNLSTSLAFYHVSDMDWLDRTHSRNNTRASRHTDRSAEAYSKLDLVIRKSMKYNRSQVDFSVILQNMIGSHYDYTRSDYTDSSFSEIDVPGSKQDRRGYFELAVRFN